MIGKNTRAGVIFDIFNNIFMVVLFVVMVYPFLYVLNYSISTPSLIQKSLLILPVGINFEAYRLLLSDSSIFNALFISVARSIIGSLGMLVITGMAGYALSRKELIAGKFFRMFFLYTMYFSAGIIPTYLLMKSLTLTGSFWVYIIPNLVNAFNMILIKTYIESIPNSLEEAVMIDGGTELDAYWRVILPVCMPVNAAVLLFAAVTHWNTFIDTQLYNAMTPELYTMQYVLYNALGAQLQRSLEDAMNNMSRVAVTGQSLKMAITIFTVVPIMLVYPFLQRYFVSGLMVGAIKA